MTDKFSRFCNSTALHGWPHLQNASSFGRVFWSVTILTVLVLALFLSSRWFFKTKSSSQSFLARLVHTKRQLYLQHWFQKQPPSTRPRFQRLFFATSTNWGKLLNKKWSKSFLWFRQSAIDSVTSVMLNLTNNLLTQEELSLAIYHEAISGWGYISSSQVDCMYT